MKIRFILFVFCIIAFIACSKKNNTANNSTQAGTQNSYEADFQFISSQTLVNSTTGQFSWQFNYADAKINNGTQSNIASVLLNNIALQYDTAGQYYITSINNGSTPCWAVNGSNTIPSFSYTPKMPTCLNWNTFPDTVDHTKAFSLFIKYDRANQITPSIYCGGPVAAVNYGFFNTTTATFSYPAATMNTYAVGTAQLLIETSYTDKVIVNGIPMSFLSRITFKKTIYIK